MIKLINYIRSEARAGNALDVSKVSAFQDEQYLKPVLEDDALLYSLHDIIGEKFDYEEDGTLDALSASHDERKAPDDDRVLELERKLWRAQQEIEARRRELEAMKLHFGTFDIHESEHREFPNGTEYCKATVGADRGTVVLGNTDSSYFASYSSHGHYRVSHMKTYSDQDRDT